MHCMLLVRGEASENENAPPGTRRRWGNHIAPGSGTVRRTLWSTPPRIRSCTDPSRRESIAERYTARSFDSHHKSWDTAIAPRIPVTALRVEIRSLREIPLATAHVSPTRAERHAMSHDSRAAARARCGCELEDRERGHREMAAPNECEFLLTTETQNRVTDDLPRAMRFGCAAAFHTRCVRKRSTREHRDATPRATSLQRERWTCQYPSNRRRKLSGCRSAPPWAKLAPPTHFVA